MRLPRLPALALHSLLLVCLVACTSAEIGDMEDDFTDLESDVLTLEGVALSSELSTSPIHVASQPFRRIGALWDATEAGAIEVSVSSDGRDFSAWAPLQVQHVEKEDASAFVGQYQVQGAMATHYRFRGTASAVASYARFELLLKSASQSIEDGEDGSQGDGNLTIRAETGVPMFGRAEWGARPDRCTADMLRPHRMTLHHTFGPMNSALSPAARLRQIQSYHMDVRGWCDIGYHYLVSADGEVWEGRSSLKRGAHTADNNDGNLGIAVMGSYKSQSLSQAGTRALGRLIHRLGEMHGIDTSSDVRSHAFYGSGLCPGDKLDAQMQDILNIAAEPGDPDDDPEAGEEEGDGQGDSGGLTDGLRVHGTVYQGADTSEFIDGATVRLGGEETTSDARGYFQFENVPAGGFTLIATKTGYQERIIARATTGTETWLSFGMSEVVDRTPTAILHGLVHYSADTAKRVPNAVVRLSTGQKTTADGTGYYRFSDLPAGRVEVTATAAGFQNASVSVGLLAGETAWGGLQMAENGGAGTTNPADNGNSGQVCFPGENNAGTTCLSLVETNAYSYPAGSGNYKRPIRFLDLDAVDLSTKLSPNFTLAEISVRKKGKYQVVQPHAIQKLQEIRNRVGHVLTVNSGFRSPTYNSSIGGATKSRHMYGDAFDMLPGATGREGLMAICRELGAGYVAKYANTGHIHCDWRSDPIDSGFFGVSSMILDDDFWSIYDLKAEIQYADGVYSVSASGYDETEGELARDWIAYDAMGNILVEVEAMDFSPPANARTVVVDVGGLMEIERIVEEESAFYN